MSKYTNEYGRLSRAAKLTYSEARKAGKCTECGTPSVAARCPQCAERMNRNRAGRPSRPAPSGVFHVCCQTPGRHRFDCDVVDVKLRSAGPVLPLVELQRRARA